jgi:hypothetical protein
LVIPKRREIRNAGNVTFNIPHLPDLPDNNKPKPGRPSTGGPIATQRRKRQKNPELYKKIGNAQKLRKNAKKICDSALNDTTTIGKTTASTLGFEFFRLEKDFKIFNIDVDFHQFVLWMTGAVQRKLNKEDDENFLSIDEIYYVQPQHRQLIEEIFPEFLVDGKFHPAKNVSKATLHNFFLWSTKHNVKAYKGMPYLAAFLSSLNQ